MTVQELDEAIANPDLTTSSRKHVEQQQRENRENENRETYVTQALMMNDELLTSRIKELKGKKTRTSDEDLRLEVFQNEQSKRTEQSKSDDSGCSIM